MQKYDHDVPMSFHFSGVIKDNNRLTSDFFIFPILLETGAFFVDEEATLRKI